MNDFFLTISVAFFAFLFGVAKDRKVGKIDVTFLLIALFGAAGYLLSLDGIGVEFQLAFTPLDRMFIVNAAINIALIFALLILAIGTLIHSGVKYLRIAIAALFLSLVGYIFLPSAVENIVFFLLEKQVRFVAPVLFVIILFFIELSSSQKPQEKEEVEE